MSILPKKWMKSPDWEPGQPQGQWSQGKGQLCSFLSKCLGKSFFTDQKGPLYCHTPWVPPGGEVPLISSVSSPWKVSITVYKFSGLKTKTKTKRGCLPWDHRQLELNTRNKLVHPDVAPGFGWICEEQDGASRGKIPDSRGFVYWMVLVFWDSVVLTILELETSNSEICLALTPESCN